MIVLWPEARKAGIEALVSFLAQLSLQTNCKYKETVVLLQRGNGSDIRGIYSPSSGEYIRGIYKKGCRCGERLRSKAGG